MKIKSNQLFWLITILAIVIILGLSYLLYNTYDKANVLVKKQFSEQQRLLAKQTAVGIEESIALLEREIEHLAKVNAIKKFNIDDARIVMTETFKYVKDIYVNDIGLIDSKGIVRIPLLAPHLTGQDFSFREYFIKASKLKTGAPVYEFITFKGVDVGEPGIIIAMPIFHPNEIFNGVLVFTIKFNDLIQGHLPSQSNSFKTWVMDSENRILFHPEFKPGTLLDQKPSPHFSFTEFIQHVKSEKSYESEYISTNGIKTMALSYPVKIADQTWFLIISASEKKVRQLLTNFSAAYLRTGLIGLFLFLCISTIVFIMYYQWNSALENKVNSRTAELALANKKLSESEEKFRGLFNNASDALYLWKVNDDGSPGLCIEVNEVACRMLGYRKDELLKMTPEDIDAKELIPKIPGIMKRLVLDGHITFEMVHLTKDGRKIPVEISSHIYTLNNNKVILSITRDITDRKRSEVELEKHRKHLKELVNERTIELSNTNKLLQREISKREQAQKKIHLQNEYLNKIMNSIPHPFYVINVNNYKVIIANDAAKLDGITENITCHSLLHDSDTPCHTAEHPCPLDEMKKTGESQIEEHIHFDKEGDPRNVEVHGHPFFNKSGKLTQMITYALDVTERKKIEEKINSALIEKEILLGEIHHRVKNNLQVIYGLLSIQSENLKYEEDKEIFRSCQNQLMSMALVHEKLYQSKDIANINLHDYIENLADVLFQSYSVNTSKIDLQLKIENARIEINSAIFCGLIISELVTNAIKHAFPNNKHGKIFISFRPLNNGKFELIVNDNGIGLPKSFDFKKPKTFGLEMVNVLINGSLNGKLDLRRKSGTEFRIYFEKKS